MDLKWEYQKKADELTLEQYGEDIEFYDLSQEEQSRIYSKAEELVMDDLADQADMRRKMEDRLWKS